MKKVTHVINQNIRETHYRSYFINAKGINAAKKKARHYLTRIGEIFGTVKKITFNGFYKSKCDIYGDNYWFDVTVLIKQK